MSKNSLMIIIVIVLVILGGFVIVSGNKKKAANQTAPIVTDTDVTVDPTSSTTTVTKPGE